MKKYKVKNWSMIFSLVSIAIVIIFSFGITTRLALMEQRYNLLLSNTMSLVDNIARVLTSLESDRVIKQLTSKVGALKKENESLKGQVKSSKRELINVSEKEKKCQEQLSKLSEQQKKAGKEQIKDAGTKKPILGNRGYLIKDGKPNK